MMNRTTKDFENIDGATISDYTINNIDYDQFGEYHALTTPIIDQTVYSEPVVIAGKSKYSNPSQCFTIFFHFPLFLDFHSFSKK